MFYKNYFEKTKIYKWYCIINFKQPYYSRTYPRHLNTSILLPTGIHMDFSEPLISARRSELARGFCIFLINLGRVVKG